MACKRQYRRKFLDEVMVVLEGSGDEDDDIRGLYRFIILHLQKMVSTNVPNIALNDGNLIPILGLGTWKSKSNEVTQAVKDAVHCGYRHIDCAMIYGNEPEVGAAIAAKISDGTVKREELFITGKLWNTFHSKELVIPAIKETLKNLRVDYLDLYLLHWPTGYQEGGPVFPKDENDKVLYSNVDYTETWLAMEECFHQGLTKSVGLSNFNKDQIERILSLGSVQPTNIQVECHPYLNQERLIEFCKSKGMTVTAYSPLGSPDRVWAKPDDPVLMEDPKIKVVAEKYKKTSAQILIRYQIQRGVICIPKSVTKSRIESNFKVFDFELSEEDMTEIDSLDCNGRAVYVSWMSDHPHFPFHAEF